jgi:acetyltransferase-like isoleucine patch superfamily enzyme
MSPICDWVPVLNRNQNYAAYEIGDYTYGHPNIVSFGEGTRLKIGKFCSIADNAVIFLGGEHHVDFVTTYPFSHFFEFAHGFTGTHPRVKGDITIGNDVWIGQEAFILSGVTVGDGAVIGARAVVAKDVKPYSVVVGNPARHLRFRVDEDLIEDLLALAWWDWPIEKIAEAMPLLLSENIRGFIEKYKVPA